MSNQELLDVYTKGLENWSNLLKQFDKRKNKQFINMKNDLNGQYIDKGEYIIVQYKNIRAFIYNDQGVAHLEEPFAIIIDDKMIYHMTTDFILNKIKQLRLYEH